MNIELRKGSIWRNYKKFARLKTNERVVADLFAAQGDFPSFLDTAPFLVCKCIARYLEFHDLLNLMMTCSHLFDILELDLIHMKAQVNNMWLSQDLIVIELSLEKTTWLIKSDNECWSPKCLKKLSLIMKQCEIAQITLDLYCNTEVEFSTMTSFVLTDVIPNLTAKGEVIISQRSIWNNDFLSDLSTKAEGVLRSLTLKFTPFLLYPSNTNSINGLIDNFRTAPYSHIHIDARDFNGHQDIALTDFHISTIIRNPSLKKLTLKYFVHGMNTINRLLEFMRTAPTFIEIIHLYSFDGQQHYFPLINGVGRKTTNHPYTLIFNSTDSHLAAQIHMGRIRTKSRFEFDCLNRTTLNDYEEIYSENEKLAHGTASILIEIKVTR